MKGGTPARHPLRVPGRGASQVLLTKTAEGCFSVFVELNTVAN